jgi:hypothetical protein
MRKNFRTDTRDVIERIFMRKILINFPAYAEFWNEYIGLNKNPRTSYLKPYGLIIPSSTLNKEEIRKTYLEMSYASYTLFCHLAGAHYQLKLLRSSLRKTSPEQRHFSHWEHFEIFYMHLGIVMYQLYHVWSSFFLIKGILRRSGDGTLRGGKGALKSLLVLKRKKYLTDRIEKLDKEMTVLRDNITHYARGAFYHIRNGFAVPWKISKNMAWDKCFSKSRLYRETTVKIENDLLLAETLLNKLYKILIEEVNDFLILKGIRINY